jgi:acetate kinase
MSDIPSFRTALVGGTGGIGENDAEAGAIICQSLAWIGVTVGTAHSRSADNPVSDFKSGSRAFVLASQEDEQIERHSFRAFRYGRFADRPDRK